MKLLLAAFALPVFALATQYEAQVITSIDPSDNACQVSMGHYADTVSNLYAGQANVKVVAVANAGHCDQAQLTSFVNQHVQQASRVQVVVKHQAVQAAGLTGYNQTVAQCVQTTAVRGRGRGGRRRRGGVLRRIFTNGPLVGQNRFRVQQFVDNCR
jgi:CO dehydrogenase/acetyl-CoA synthase beta subunit